MKAPTFALAVLAGLAASSSYRNIPTSKEALQKLLKEMLDRIERLEKGSGLQGIVSFGPVVQIGDIRLSVTNGAGNARNLVATNVKTGTSATIATL